MLWMNAWTNVHIHNWWLIYTEICWVKCNHYPNDRTLVDHGILGYQQKWVDIGPWNRDIGISIFKIGILGYWVCWNWDPGIVGYWFREFLFNRTILILSFIGTVGQQVQVKFNKPITWVFNSGEKFNSFQSSTVTNNWIQRCLFMLNYWNISAYWIQNLDHCHIS